MKAMKCLAVLALASLGLPPSAEAGPYSDELAKCLVSSTTLEDKGTLVKWIFAIAAQHPQLAGVSTLTVENRTDLNKQLAGMVETLLTVTCKSQLQSAVRYEGGGALEQSFGVLGEAAMMELFSDNAVAEGLSEFAKYLDGKKFEAVLKQPAGVE